MAEVRKALSSTTSSAGCRVRKLEAGLDVERADDGRAAAWHAALITPL